MLFWCSVDYIVKQMVNFVVCSSLGVSLRLCFAALCNMEQILRCQFIRQTKVKLEYPIL